MSTISHTLGSFVEIKRIPQKIGCQVIICIATMSRTIVCCLSCISNYLLDWRSDLFNLADHTQDSDLGETVEA